MTSERNNCPQNMLTIYPFVCILFSGLHKYARFAESVKWSAWQTLRCSQQFFWDQTMLAPHSITMDHRCPKRMLVRLEKRAVWNPQSMDVRVPQREMLLLQHGKNRRVLRQKRRVLLWINSSKIFIDKPSREIENTISYFLTEV